jgi:hypothetical protein
VFGRGWSSGVTWYLLQLRPCFKGHLFVECFTSALSTSDNSLGVRVELRCWHRRFPALLPDVSNDNVCFNSHTLTALDSSPNFVQALVKQDCFYIDLHRKPAPHTNGGPKVGWQTRPVMISSTRPGQVPSPGHLVLLEATEIKIERGKRVSSITFHSADSGYVTQKVKRSKKEKKQRYPRQVRQP